jgi:hypothetical protein
MTDRYCGPIIPVEVTVVVTDVDDQIAAGYDKIQIHRSTSGEGGPFAELTTSATRIDLESGQTTYIYEDEEGSSDFWYRFRLYNSTTFATSAFSDPQPGEPDPALSILSIDELKTIYLFGLDLTDDQGNPYPDLIYVHSIKAAVSWVEDKLDIPIIPVVIEEEKHDFFADDWPKWMMLELTRHPVISLESVKLVMPGNQEVHNFSKDWISLQRFEGHVNIVPGPRGSSSIALGFHHWFFPWMHRSVNKFIPDVFRVAYTAGFGRPPEGSWGFEPGSEPASISHPDPKIDKLPSDLKELVGKIAAFGPLNIAGDLLGGAGIASQSIGIDGLSQSFNTTSSATSSGYGARLIQYRQEIKDWMPTLQKYYHGSKTIVV